MPAEIGQAGDPWGVTLRCSGHWESCLCVGFVLKCVWQMLFSCQTDLWARPQEVSPSLSSLACPANHPHGPRVVLSVTISCPCWFAAANSAKVCFYRGKQQIYSFSADCLANLCLSFHQQNLNLCHCVFISCPWNFQALYRCSFKRISS